MCTENNNTIQIHWRHLNWATLTETLTHESDQRFETSRGTKVWVWSKIKVNCFEDQNIIWQKKERHRIIKKKIVKLITSAPLHSKKRDIIKREANSLFHACSYELDLIKFQVRLYLLMEPSLERETRERKQIEGER
jgi:hypothetical protein